MWRQFLLSLNIKTDTCIMGIHRNAFPAPCQFYIPRPCFTPTKGQARKKCSIAEVEFIYYIIVALSLIFLLTTQNLCSLLNKFDLWKLARFSSYYLFVIAVIICIYFLKNWLASQPTLTVGCSFEALHRLKPKKSAQSARLPHPSRQEARSIIILLYVSEDPIL